MVHELHTYKTKNAELYVQAKKNSIVFLCNDKSENGKYFFYLK